MSIQERASIRIGISSCLVGDHVRYNGGHCRNSYVCDILGPFVEFVTVCPEVEIGLGTPRETIRLVRQGRQIRLQSSRGGEDLTDKMRRYSSKRVRELQRLELSGYVLKKDSPSCGMERVRVHGEKSVQRDGRGIFADVLMAACPDLPVEEEGRLNDARLRENFVERVFAYRRLKDLFSGRWTHGDLVCFHTAEKFLLLAHDPTVYRSLGRLVANSNKANRRELSQQYTSTFMQGLRRLATTRKNCNVLQHILGYFRKTAPVTDRQELEGLIEDFRRGLVPLIVPITLIRHYARTYDATYLNGQTYLAPHPKELMLRNHV